MLALLFLSLVVSAQKLFSIDANGTIVEIEVTHSATTTTSTMAFPSTTAVPPTTSSKAVSRISSSVMSQSAAVASPTLNPFENVPATSTYNAAAAIQTQNASSASAVGTSFAFGALLLIVAVL